MVKKHARPGWDEYFLTLAATVQTRSNCLRQAVGVVIVKDKRIIATGYNGTPAGIKNCFDGGCKRCLDRHENTIKQNERKDLCICIHAEQNALLQCAYHGASAKGAVLYSTISPCIQCAKAIINAGIGAVYYTDSHSDRLGEELLAKAKIKATRYTS